MYEKAIEIAHNLYATLKENGTSHGVVGTLTSAGAITISLNAVERWLRLVSLVVGIAVGVITGISVLRKMPKRR